MSDGPESVHYVLELPVGSPAFLHDAADPLGLARNPIYAALHEACWADGGATNWSAQRMAPDELELHGRAHLSVDVRGVRRAGADAGGGRGARGL